jgi:drug/metabolite transporter (DMT)-like permease
MADNHRSVLGSYFLKEKLGVLGKLGCAMCLLGSVIIVLHAPPDKQVETVNEILGYAVQPGMSRDWFAALTGR